MVFYTALLIQKGQWIFFYSEKYKKSINEKGGNISLDGFVRELDHLGFTCSVAHSANGIAVILSASPFI